MKTLFNESVYNQTVGRIRDLRADMTPKWGFMSPGTAICHLYDCLHYTFAMRSAPVRSSFYATTLGKWITIYSSIPWPKGRVKSPPEFLATRPSENFPTDVSMLLGILSRFLEGPDQQWGTSPVFGPLSPAEWARLSWRHHSHHLSQFGV